MRPRAASSAAATTSLPEQFGGERNWDYRYCWIRDATLTPARPDERRPLRRGGGLARWLLRAVAGSAGDMQIMYGLAGERRLTEWESPWLPGYAGSRPVRIGNAAHRQFQLDVYGELMDAFHQARTGGLRRPARLGAAAGARGACEQGLDASPTTASGRCAAPRQHFTHSKVMAWVAFDRAVKARRGITASRAGRTMARAARRDPRRGLRQGLRSASAAASRRPMTTDELDASLLLMPQVGFLPPTIRAFVGTVDGDRARAAASTASCMRYDTARVDDGLPPGEGAFLACSFWLADAYVLARPRRTTPSGCSSACSRSATTSACWPRSTIRAPAARSATSRRPSRTSPDQHGLQPDQRLKPSEQRASTSVRQL